MVRDVEWTGAQITEPGLYSRVPLDLYHRGNICVGPSVSSSGLRKCFNYSPAHFYATWSGNPEYEPEEKEAFVLGRAVHHLFLGEANFSLLFNVEPPEYPDSKTGELKPWHNSANYCKKWRAEQEKAGRIVLRGKDVDNIRGMARSLSQVQLISHKDGGILNGAIERSIFWLDKKTGLWIKVRPDSIPRSSTDFVDLKTTTSVLFDDLQRTIGDLGYHQQGALIRRAAREVLGLEGKITFTLVFVEKTRPWCVRIVELKENDLDRGDRQNEAALDVIAQCLKTKKWPGPGGSREDAVFIELPEWKQKQIDDRLKYGIQT